TRSAAWATRSASDDPPDTPRARRHGRGRGGGRARLRARLLHRPERGLRAGEPEPAGAGADRLGAPRARARDAARAAQPVPAHVRQLPFLNPFQLVDRSGGTYRPEQGFEQVAPLLPGVTRAREVAAGE